MDIIVNGCTVRLNDIDSIISYKKRLSQLVFDLTQELKEKQKDLQDVEKFLKYNCKHSWVIDSIDSMNGYREGVNIKYCEHCELTIKTNSFFLRENSQGEKNL